MMSRLKTSSEMQDEWDRISQNPDNVIVSDVLREVLSDYYTEAPTKSQRATVLMRTESQTASMKLLRFEQTPHGWALLCQF